MSKALGQVLKSLRKRSELSQRQVADVLHIDRSTYAYYESGLTEPKMDCLRKLAQIYNVDLLSLLPDEDGNYSVRFGDVIKPEFLLKKEEQQEEPVLDVRDEKIYSIAKEERSILIWYRTLSPEDKEKFRDFAQKLGAEQE